MSLRCGILGLPNVGKSTLFKAITEKQVDVQNYPFCTIEPNIATVPVHDIRLSKLASIVDTSKIIPATVEIVDIAGLVKGASKGEGLGNKFLSHVREVDALIHVIRCFEDSNIVHVEGSINPIRDIETIETELILSDLESMERQIQRLEKDVRKDKKLEDRLELAKAIYSFLSDGKPGRHFFKNNEEMNLAKTFFLLSLKPILYVANVSEKDALKGNDFSKNVEDYAKENKAQSVVISASIEAEISMLDQQERIDFLRSLGLTTSGSDKIVRASYELLGLQTYFTAGKKEVKAWTIKKNDTAYNAAGVIHTDFQKGFISAEVIKYKDMINLGSESKVKESGKLNIVGKEYVVENGDIILFRFNI